MKEIVATDFTRYQPPGVYTDAMPGPQIAVRTSLPTAVGIFGLSRGFRPYRESLLINPDTKNEDNTYSPGVNRTLTQTGIKTETVVVKNPNSGAPYILDTDYTVVRLTAGPDTNIATRDDLYTIERVIDGGHIDAGDTVEVSYEFTDPAYYDVGIFYDYDDVKDYYGEPYDDAGNLQSELTLACKFAFLNGAFQVVTVAVDPANPSVPTVSDYGHALDKFRDEELVAIVVPASGLQPIHELVHQHVQAQSNNRYERVAILALDGTRSAVSTSQRQLNAQAVTDQRCAMVSPATFQYWSTELNKEITVGGQYMAAALAGMAVSKNAAEPLTRKVVTGFKDVTEKMREGEKNLETQNGLMVIEKTKRQLIQVRHGVTTNPADLLTREWNIIRQQDAMVYRIRDYLENDNLIGRPILDTTLINVKASAESALQSLVRDEIIRRYNNLKVRQLMSNPDVIEVKYDWLPAFPLNYILVKYAVSLSTGDITTNGATQSGVSQTQSSDDGNTLSSAP